MRAMGGNVPIKGFIESSFTDWSGKVAAVLFLPGCNFRCPFCHNRDLVLTPRIFEDYPLETVIDGLRENEGWLDGVIITGGEPTIHPGLPGLMETIRETGLMLRLDTNGSRPDVLKSLIEQGLIDAAAMDVKAPLDAKRYSAASGVPVDVELIRESINLLAESGLEVISRTTVVPGLHDAESVRAIAGELGGRPLTLQNFRPADTLDPAFNGIKPFTDEEFSALKECITAETRRQKCHSERSLWVPRLRSGRQM